jgi:hypothetical protein
MAQERRTLGWPESKPASPLTRRNPDLHIGAQESQKKSEGKTQIEALESNCRCNQHLCQAERARSSQ